MRKVYTFLIACSLFTMHEVFAQCTPRTNMTGYIEPETLDKATAGSPYSQVVYFKVPKDTVLEYNGTPVAVKVVNSKILSMEGIPSGFTYQCNKANCTFAGGANGCAVITGTPTLAQVGSYPIKIFVQTNTLIANSIPLSRIDSGVYDFEIVAPVSNRSVSMGKLFQVYPNPAHQQLSISISAGEAGEFTISNLLGNVLFRKNLSATEEFSLSTISWPAGVYLVQMKSGDKINTQKVLIRH
jgi:hypothetical protein